MKTTIVTRYGPKNYQAHEFIPRMTSHSVRVYVVMTLGEVEGGFTGFTPVFENDPVLLTPYSTIAKAEEVLEDFLCHAPLGTTAFIQECWRKRKEVEN